MTALGSGALAVGAANSPGPPGSCRFHVDVPAWSARGWSDPPELAEELAAVSTAAIDVKARHRLLLKIMTTPNRPDRLAIHSRVSGRPPGASATSRRRPRRGRTARGGRFLTGIRLYYPGAELICEPSLSLEGDPYLADYRVDEMAVLPPVLALEALAQAASVLAGPSPSGPPVGSGSTAPIVIAPGRPAN